MGGNRCPLMRQLFQRAPPGASLAVNNFFFKDPGHLKASPTQFTIAVTPVFTKGLGFDIFWTRSMP
jgi:hypothetical protein